MLIDDLHEIPGVEISKKLEALCSLTIEPKSRDSFLSAIRGEGGIAQEEIIRQAKGLSPLLALQYESGVGVWEEFTLEEHTAAVLRQYANYMQGQIDEKYKDFFLLFLIFHDIGKPAAVQMGDKTLQHPFSTLILQNLLPQLGAASYLNLTEGLLAGDFLGGYVKKELSLEEVCQKIRESATTAELPIMEFYALLKAYYLVDASAYTKKAVPHFYKPPKMGLSWLFSFEGGKIDFSTKEIRNRIAALEKALRP